MARKRSKVSHGKEVFYIACLLILLLVGFWGYLGPGGYLEMKRTQAELATHKARVDALTKDNSERFTNIQLLREDSETLERYARQKGYARKGEMVQEVPAQKPAKPSVRKK